MWRRGSTVPQGRHAWEAEEELPGVRTRGALASAWAEQCSGTRHEPPGASGHRDEPEDDGVGGDKALSRKGEGERQRNTDPGERCRQRGTQM